MQQIIHLEIILSYEKVHLNDYLNFVSMKHGHLLSKGYKYKKISKYVFVEIGFIIKKYVWFIN